MGQLKTLLCFFTGEPALNLDDNFEGYSYEVDYMDVPRVVRLKFDEYEDNAWFRYNRLRIWQTVEENDDWHLLERGVQLRELREYLMASAEYLD